MVIVLMLFVVFLVFGVVFGIVVGMIKRDCDIVEMMSKMMSLMGGYIVLVFFVV